MFKTAPRYLSGVSVFYGDDITRRTVDGEIAFIVGQSNKGTRLPIQLSSVETAVAIYGVDSPLSKALYEFWDGYSDSPKAQTLRLITLRVGGIPALLETSYGLTIETVDAYDGIENDLYVYIDNTSAADANVKVWNSDKSIVYDGLAGIDANFVKVAWAASLKGNGAFNSIYGTDLDANPTATGTTLAQIKLLDFSDVTGNNALTVDEGSFTTAATVPVTEVTIGGLANAGEAEFIPNFGTIRLYGTKNAISVTTTLDYTAKGTFNDIAKTVTLTLSSSVTSDLLSLLTDPATVTFITSTLKIGDSQLGISARKKYELFKNSLADIEQYTPDYIVPGGITFDESATYTKAKNFTTTVTSNATSADTTLQVAGAAQWTTAGNIDVDGGVTGFKDQLTYTAKVAGVNHYTLTIKKPTYKVETNAVVTPTASVVAAAIDAEAAKFVLSGASSAATFVTNIGNVTSITQPEEDAAAAISSSATAAKVASAAAVSTPSALTIAAAEAAFLAFFTLVTVTHVGTFTTVDADDLYAALANAVIDSNDIVQAQVVSTAGTLLLKMTDVDGDALTLLRSQGAIGVTGNYLKYTNVVISSGVATLTLDVSTPITGTMISVGTFEAGEVVTKVIIAAIANTFTVEHSWYDTAAKFEVGIGFVKETDEGGYYSFEWSNTKEVGYGLAHFGYLIANFCNSAAIGYNTPLSAMNTSLPDSYERVDIMSWIGKYPTYNYIAGVNSTIRGVGIDGEGLLGNPILAGSTTYNRTYMNNVNDGTFVDPAYGLLLTDEEQIDGHEVKDTFSKSVDLGKFMIVGAGLLTFANRASANPYVNACGTYALGMLAGKPKDQGISFSQIGVGSNTSVGVVVHRKNYNDLANLGYIVVTREKGLGWVINNGNTTARSDSGYKLISTTRIVKEVIEGKRSSLAGFIGKALNRYAYEAAKTRVADGFKKDVQNGLLNSYGFDLQIDPAGQAIGKLYLKCSLNTPLELVQVDIDTVIDRSIVTGS